MWTYSQPATHRPSPCLSAVVISRNNNQIGFDGVMEQLTDQIIYINIFLNICNARSTNVLRANVRTDLQNSSNAIFLLIHKTASTNNSLEGGNDEPT